MRLWITGAGGMLGKRVVETAKQRGHDVISSSHWDCQIDDLGIVTRAVREINPDAIINCAGKRPGSHPFEMIQANALGPHILASTKVRLVHMSTDCVFSGRSRACGRILGGTSSSHPPDPEDLYGRTKLTGEVDAPHVLNVRGSFIGPEHGFLRWLLTARGKVEAWDNAYWNGTTADIMAKHLVELAESDRTGVLHLASEEIVSKGWMVEMFAATLDLPVEIEHVDEPKIFRSLELDLALPNTKWAMEAYAKELRVEAA